MNIVLVQPIINPRQPDFSSRQNIHIVDQANVTWPDHPDQCVPILDNLVRQARRAHAALVFQSLPLEPTQGLRTLRTMREIHVKVGVVTGPQRPRSQSIEWV